MSKFLKYFKRTITEAAAPIQEPVEPMDDASAFNQSFESPENAEALKDEMGGLGLDPEQKANLLKRADHYASKIDGMILPTLRKLHNDIVSGVFAQIAPDIKGLAGINEDLAGLAESLRGRVRDAVIKQDKNDKKQQ